MKCHLDVSTGPGYAVHERAKPIPQSHSTAQDGSIGQPIGPLLFWTGYLALEGVEMDRIPGWLFWMGAGALAYGLLSNPRMRPRKIRVTDGEHEEPMLLDTDRILLVRVSDMRRGVEDCTSPLSELWIEGETTPLLVCETMLELAQELQGFLTYHLCEPTGAGTALVHPGHIVRIAWSEWTHGTTGDRICEIFLDDGKNLYVEEPLDIAIGTWGNA